MKGQPNPGHWKHSHGRYAGTDSVVLDPRSIEQSLSNADEGARQPIPKDPITGVKFGLAFSVVIWAFLLSLGVAIFG